jgi:thiamine-monophosphate kinase
MPDDPDESFVIDTLLAHRRDHSASAVNAAGGDVPLLTPGDDAAMVADSVAVTVDTMVEGVHWDERLSAADVGWKLAAVNASDINAMGGLPTWAVLSIALPAPLDRGWVESFSAGLSEALKTWKVNLVGGDTTRSPGPRVVSLTLAGEVTHPIGRHGAEAGQNIWVTGPLGGPAAAFFSDDPDARALEALRRPQPPIGLGAALAKAGHVTAMMDLSDGLARDLPRLCQASQVGAEIEPERLPAHCGLKDTQDKLSLMTSFGEEYELLFTADSEATADIVAVCSSWGQTAHCIGVINADPTSGAQLVGTPWPDLCFTHFGGTS